MKAFIKKTLMLFGPGIIFSSLSIGQDTIILQTVIGSQYGMKLLWILVAVYLFYYPIYEYGVRYAVATGDSLLDGYWKLKARRPLFYFFLVFLCITPSLVLGSVVGLTGSALYAAFPSIHFNWWCVVAYAVTVTIVITGRYKAVEGISMVLLLVLVAVTFVAFVIAPPPPGEFVRGLVPSIPAAAGIWVIIVALLRTPSDPAASIFLSEWAREKRKEWGDEPSLLTGSLKKSLIDIRSGFFISFLTAIAFLSLGTVVFRPMGVVPQGLDLIERLSEMYTTTLGTWIFPVFIIAIFAAFWGSYVSVMDGVHRLFKNVIGHLFKPREKTVERVGMVYIATAAGAGLLLATILQRPLFMVILALSMALIYYPLVIGLNIYCVTRMVEPQFRPGRLNVLLACCGFVLAMTGLVLLVLVRVLKVVQ